MEQRKLTIGALFRWELTDGETAGGNKKKLVLSVLNHRELVDETFNGTV